MAAVPVVRELVFEDLDELLRAYAVLSPNAPTNPPRPDVEGIWREICDDPRILHLGAFDGERLAATCHAAIVPNLTRGARPYAVIENVITLPEYRRKGVGSAVMQALLDRCWAAGCYKAMLQSGKPRGEAHSFYEANGFEKDAKFAFQVRRK